jgi:hypothetical protein
MEYENSHHLYRNIPLCFLHKYWIHNRIIFQPKKSIFSNMFYPCSSLMETSHSCRVSGLFIILLTFFVRYSPCLSWSLHPSYINSMAMHRNHTAISYFRLLNRRTLMECSNVTDPSIKMKVSRKSNLADEEYLTVTVSRVLHPSKSDWVGMISPSHSK